MTLCISEQFLRGRATGDIKYYENVATAMKRIHINTKATVAYALIQDISRLNSGFWTTPTIPSSRTL